MDDKDLVDHRTTEIEVIKGKLPRAFILHSKEIVAAVVIGVIITVFSSIILIDKIIGFSLGLSRSSPISVANGRKPNL